MTASSAGFVAIGTERVGRTGDVRPLAWTSSDGKRWSRVPVDGTVLGPAGPLGPGDEPFSSRHVLADVTAGEDGFVAVGFEHLNFGVVPDSVRRGDEISAAVWTSADGTSWSRLLEHRTIFAGAGADREMTGVTQSRGRFVAVGYESDSDRALSAAVWTSEDGEQWSRVPHVDEFGDDASFFQMNDVTAGGPGFVAVGIEVPEDAAREINQVQPVTPEGVLSVGTGPKGGPTAAIWVSDDGIQWQRLPQERMLGAGVEERALVSVTAGGPGLIAVGWRLVDRELDPEVWISTDGNEWMLARDTDGAFTARDRQVITAATPGGPGVVAVGASGSQFDFSAAVWSSP